MRTHDGLPTHFVKVCPIMDILIGYTSFKYFLKSKGKLRSKVHCENPHHKQHVENSFRKFPTADREETFAIIKIDLKYWYISYDLKLSTTSCCQVCNISKDILRGTFRSLLDGTGLILKPLPVGDHKIEVHIVQNIPGRESDNLFLNLIYNLHVTDPSLAK